MPPDKDPSVEKAAVLRLVESRIGPTRAVSSRRPDWHVSANGATSVFITFSKDEDLFYDVSQDDLEAWSGYKKAFVIFVLGGSEDAAVLPLSLVRDRVVRKLKSKERGNFKLHVAKTARLQFREAPFVDLDDFRNAYELLAD